MAFSQIMKYKQKINLRYCFRNAIFSNLINYMRDIQRILHFVDGMMSSLIVKNKRNEVKRIFKYT